MQIAIKAINYAYTYGTSATDQILLASNNLRRNKRQRMLNIYEDLSNYENLSEDDILDKVADYKGLQDMVRYIHKTQTDPTYQQQLNTYVRLAEDLAQLRIRRQRQGWATGWLTPL